MYNNLYSNIATKLELKLYQDSIKRMCVGNHNHSASGKCSKLFIE